jgi:SWI/SNF-related matrix-associated actin-dependent regulator of chromatin subfamily A member 5
MTEREEVLSTIVSLNLFDVLVTSYEGVRKCLPELRSKRFHYLVVDEAHKMKNERSSLYETLLNLNYKRSVLLTGTPLQNHLHELWALLNFVRPEVFRNSTLLDDWFELCSALDNSSSTKSTVENNSGEE